MLVCKVGYVELFSVRVFEFWVLLNSITLYEVAGSGGRGGGE